MGLLIILVGIYIGISTGMMRLFEGGHVRKVGTKMWFYCARIVVLVASAFASLLVFALLAPLFVDTFGQSDSEFMVGVLRYTIFSAVGYFVAQLLYLRTYRAASPEHNDDSSA